MREDGMDDETIEVETMTIACDGGGGPLGHPNVFLHLDDQTHDIACPYCSKRFQLKEGATIAAGH
jgi:uncharacterized Zn-finger protein